MTPGVPRKVLPPLFQCNHTAKKEGLYRHYREVAEWSSRTEEGCMSHLYTHHSINEGEGMEKEKALAR